MERRPSGLPQEAVEPVELAEQLVSGLGEDDHTRLEVPAPRRAVPCRAMSGRQEKQHGD